MLNFRISTEVEKWNAQIHIRFLDPFTKLRGQPEFIDIN